MSRTYTYCPCEKCLVLAICKGRDEYLECSLLYKYIRTGIEYHGKPHQKKNYRKRKLESIFKRKIDMWTVTNLHRVHPELAVWWKD